MKTNEHDRTSLWADHGHILGILVRRPVGITSLGAPTNRRLHDAKFGKKYNAFSIC